MTLGPEATVPGLCCEAEGGGARLCPTEVRKLDFNSENHH